MHRVFEVGDCWYATPGQGGVWFMHIDGDELHRTRLTIAPEHTNARPAIVVLPYVGLPMGVPFCLHSPTLGPGGWGNAGWTVSGELPDVTVSPSIDVRGYWHGHLRAGVLE